jgi:hypothetical protein
MPADAVVTCTARSANPLIYQLRVDLDETSPPVWRRVEVDADLYLDELHAVIQAAFEWTDSHLHRFATALEHVPDPESYLGPRGSSLEAMRLTDSADRPRSGTSSRHPRP